MTFPDAQRGRAMAVFRKSSIGVKVGFPAVGVDRLSAQEVEKRRHLVVCSQNDWRWKENVN